MNVISPPPVLSLDTLHDTFADVLVAWGNFESAQPTQRLYVNNLIGWETNRSYTSRDDVRNDLRTLHSGFLKAGDEQAAGRVRSFIAYLDLLKDQSKFSLPEYFGRMTGLALKPFTESQIAEVRGNLMKCIRSLKPGFSDADFEKIEQVLDSLEEELPKDKFILALQDQLEKDRSTVKRLTGLDANVRCNIGTGILSLGAKADAGWEKGRVSITFSEQLTSYRMIANQITVRHENWGHGLQFMHLAERAKIGGNLPRSYGILTTTGSEIMHSEAMAESVSRLFVSEGGNNSLSEAMHWLLMHRRMAGFNARLLFHEKGDSVGRMYLSRIAPYMKKRDIDTLATEMLPANRAAVHYKLLYAPVHYALSRFAYAVGPTAFGKFLGEVLPTLKDANGLNEAMERHARSSRYNFPLA